jgi:predicted nucleic acid-binding protein
LSQPIIVDTGGLLRALARTPNLQPSFPEYQAVLTAASRVIVPALVLAEVDYCLREQRAAMRKLIAEIFDPGTRYEYEHRPGEPSGGSVFVNRTLPRLQSALDDVVLGRDLRMLRLAGRRYGRRRERSPSYAVWPRMPNSDAAARTRTSLV